MRKGFVAIVSGLCACAAVTPFKDPAQVEDGPKDSDLPPVVVDETGLEPDTDLPVGPDRDLDGITDADDLCPDLYDPTNVDADGDGDGDPCDIDRDGDGIPNDRDLFADDYFRPGSASQDHVYAHGPGELWRLDVPTRVLTRIGAFTFDKSGSSITDVAIDRYGVLYAVSFSDLFVCHPDYAECWWVGRLPGSYNGLTFVPDAAGTEDVLVGISTSGTWTALYDVPFSLRAAPWGAFGNGYSSSGDAFYIAGQGAYAAVNKSGSRYVVVAEVNTSGKVLSDLVELQGHSGVYGIAGWTQIVFAFSSNGDILEIKPSTGGYITLTRGISWWGAGVKTVVVP